MYDILTLNKISQIGLKELDSKYAVSDCCENPDGIIVRSAAMHDFAFSDKTVAVARAGAGVNNIPVEDCTKKGIVVFNTPGANANAVKELVVAGLMLTSRRVAAAYDWCKTLKGEGENVGKLVEKGKSQFAGPEILGKTLGVVGLGAIGRLVAVAANNLGMKIVGYDPYFNEALKGELPADTEYVDTLEAIYEKADYITLHLPCTKDTKGMINADTIARMKDGVRILNFARGELVVGGDMAEAVKAGKVAAYVTDFPSDEVIGVENVTALPHLGASTPESEENCAYMAAVEIREYLEKGNIKNSVNFPNVEVEGDGERVGVIHYNTLTTVNDVLGAFMSNGVETKGFASKAKGDFAYTLVVADKIPDAVVKALEANEDVIKVRKI
ncbi:MAG: 3-phosphoglycerate dehydrogenase [Ruminococcaceae bacterium]|nr:3-phosphoglycerate dehydrogenase [Oscillospiraceae bacterium]